MLKKSHELQWLELMHQRGGLSESELKNYQRLKRGFEGEERFDELYNFFLGKSVQSVDNVTYQLKNMVVQIDKIIQIGNTLYVIDVKNYQGNYTYENNEWRVGTKLLTHNILEQLRRAVRLIQSIIEDANLKMDVKGIIVFMNPDSEIRVLDSVEEEILSYNDMIVWLSKATIDDHESIQKDWMSLLKIFEIEGYRTNQQCEAERFKNLTKGIRCTKCGDFQMKEQRYTCVCVCGNVEVKETAYVRTICEYGLIMHHKLIKIGDIIEFFGNKVNRGFLKYILGKYFTMTTSSGRYSAYENKGLLIQEWFVKELSYFSQIENRKKWKSRNL